MTGIHIEENGIYVELLVTDKKQLKLVHCSCVPLSMQLIENIYHLDEGFPLVQINCAGFDRPFERHGNKYVVTSPGCFLTYEGYTKEKNQWGNLYCFVQEELQSQLKVISYLQFYENCKVIRSWSEVRNNGVEEQTLEYLSSFSYTGFEKEGEGYAQEKMTLSIPHNGWQKEFNWRTYSLDELGMVKTQYKSIERSSKTIEVFNTGNWSTKEYLPMGYLENTSGNTGLLWQIEHNGSWHYEIADQNDFMVLNLSGPTEIQSHWSRRLSNGESFVSVPVAIAVTDANKEHAFAEMTIYRRNIRRINRDNRELPVIFNDYMNCLWADPTTEKEISVSTTRTTARAW